MENTAWLEVRNPRVSIRSVPVGTDLCMDSTWVCCWICASASLPYWPQKWYYLLSIPCVCSLENTVLHSYLCSYSMLTIQEDIYLLWKSPVLFTGLGYAVVFLSSLKRTSLKKICRYCSRYLANILFPQDTSHSCLKCFPALSRELLSGKDSG